MLNDYSKILFHFAKVVVYRSNENVVFIVERLRGLRQSAICDVNPILCGFQSLLLGVITKG